MQLLFEDFKIAAKIIYCVFGLNAYFGLVDMTQRAI
jgi:hypothetical protein